MELSQKSDTPTLAREFPFSKWGLEVAKSLDMEQKLDFYANHPVVLQKIRVMLGVVKAEKAIFQDRLSDWEFEVASYLVFTRYLVSNSLSNGARETLARKYFSQLAQRIKAKNLSQEVLDTLLESVGFKTKRTQNVKGRVVVEIPLSEYLRVVSELEGNPKTKLTNLPLERGVIRLSGAQLVTLLSDFVQQQLVSIFRKKWELSGKAETPDYLAQVDMIAKEYLKSSGLPEIEEVGVIESLFPPCITSYIKKVKAGGEVGHFDSFLFASFMRAIGAPKESVLEVLSHASNFNSNIANYQVSHVYGETGGRIEYTPPNCDNVKLSRLCPIEGYCHEFARHPLTVYLRNYKKQSTQK
ncbi:hypothetical protein B9Q11_03095 [Candidatus Marsarchaeota G2 archaeon ECH_B_SAG-F08]|uniref:DNA primase large subunit C-terminal domain-containing protein n=5 Tax=Candidatus Marsarchaeota TaxID=1978152 RepID=A0A2R6BZ79_9ARCH|nr:MAG: hypothetical protein B9Q01_09005 [Candidatus Marsarchaeota G1 archaeon OSP_D]PSN84859.1 MAG: hypothetical protein B9Q02_08480 [Candidatus Marsarchaeota G1 archaeon BE_D]PSN87466.1 MAG: hypothetical protein B9Q00_08800 [Candidatus Marsarchaeota G1 archaeon OSP_C]PSN98018.1 MAG: hypothetical protein B9Q11_03095 [Candidatus Marsarchaeota G2 archaeon ECH_B_SAG-F08]PSO03958.1 MAG: hypothetical protein B9Q12_03355 [Candidatus Marsarchaeota G2 archaeon ECH_B_SAG-G06]